MIMAPAANLEIKVVKFREEAELTRKENAQQFGDILRAISDLTEAMGDLKKNKEPIFEFGSFGYSDDEDPSKKKKREDDGDKGPRRLVTDFRKLKAPIFEGEDAYGWIYRVERYFEVQGIGGKDQLKAAALCMDGAALSWYRWSEGRNPFRSWDGLKDRLLERFQPSHEGSVYEQFMAVSQEGTAREYVSTFERMAGQLGELPEKIMEGKFINGLKPDLRSAVRVMQPESLTHAMKIAVMMDENKFGMGVPRSSGWLARIGNNGPLRQGFMAASGNQGDKKDISKPLGQPGQFKRLTEAELAAKRAKGLCFRCDSKFMPGHCCPSKTIQVLLVGDLDEEGDEEGDESEPDHAHLDTVEVSLNSVSGLTPPHTMKVRGDMGVYRLWSLSTAVQPTILSHTE